MIKPRIITCAGYYGTGSSAVTDFVSEFDNVLSFGDFEFTILFDVDGVRDLEYNIVENYDRHKSSHAVKKFKKLIDYLSGISFFRMYEKFFDGEFNRISCDFLDKLIVGKYRSVWREDLRDRGYAFRIRKYVIKKIFKILSLGLYKTKTSLPREEAFLVKSLTENEFCELVKEYVNQLVCSLNKEHGKEVIMLDQFLPSSHISDHSKYCENIKCLVVERDPRDIYLLEKEVWKSNWNG